jgi:hypothetical protein
MKVFMEKRRGRLPFQLVLLMLLLVWVASAQVWDKQSVHVNVDLVNLYVTVRNNHGRLISGLDRDSFTVLEDNAVQTVTHFSRETGGRLFVPSGTDQLASDFNKLANELHSYYTIGYRSTNAARDGSFRKIRINIPKHTYSVRTRAGYYAPGELLNSSLYPE